MVLIRSARITDGPALRGLALSAVVMIATVAGAEPPSNGRLVIVGGALSPKNQAVYDSVIQSAAEDSPIGIVPLASGVPEESGPLSVEDFMQYAKNPERVFDTKLVHTDLVKAASAESAELLKRCGALWFTGGDQSRIVTALRPEQGDTLGYKAILELLARGGAVGGSSAGAAMMSDPMIRSGDSDEALLLGATDILGGPGVCVGRGMGFFKYGLSDQHFLQRGRFGRLLVALEATDQNLGFGISENCALVVDLANESMSMIGDRAVTVIDRSSATQEGFNRADIRVHLLSAGDTFDGRKSIANAATAKQRMSSARSDSSPPKEFSDIWRRNVIGQMIWTLAKHPDSVVVGTDGNFDLRFSADESTSFYTKQANGEEGFTAIGVRLDVVAREGIETKIESAKSRQSRRG